MKKFIDRCKKVVSLNHSSIKTRQQGNARGSVCIEYPLNLGCISMFSVNLTVDKTSMTPLFCFFFCKNASFGAINVSFFKTQLEYFCAGTHSANSIYYRSSCIIIAEYTGMRLEYSFQTLNTLYCKSQTPPLGEACLLRSCCFW